MSNEEIVDYLDEDRTIPGQKYVCLSFVSPEKVLDDKKIFNLYRFMKSGKANTDLEFEKFQEEYKNYCDDEDEALQTEFDTISDFQTSVRGVKIRGVYDNERAAKIRAQVLQKIDNSFHVFIGQVGFWLPWDPSANKIEEQEYLEENLNKLVKEYNKNQVKKDMFYEEKKSEQKKAALEHSLRQKKKNKEERREELEKQKALETESSPVETESSPVETESSPVKTESSPVETESSPVETESSPVKTESSPVKTESSPVETESSPVETESSPVETESSPVEGENVTVTVDENELKNNLDKMDPWMQRKMEGSENQ